MKGLAVVMVTWNVRDLALQALQSLLDDLAASELDADVYVVDSASTDGTAEAIAQQFPQVRLTASRENLGFGKANNLALRQIGFGTAEAAALPQVVYLLNPDTITQQGATRTLYEALLAQADVGLVGAQLAYADGSFQHGAFKFPGLRQLWVEFFPTPGRLYESGFNGRYPRGLYERGEPFDVDFTLGATMMLRREVIQQTGMFDERFFMYCEEIDWAWRIQRSGWRVQCVPAARVTHLAGQSTGQARPENIIHLWTSRLQLYQRYQPAWKARLARWMIAVGMRLKMRELQQKPADNHDAVREAYRTVAQKALGRA